VSDVRAIDDPTFDALRASVGGDPEFLADLIETYVTEASGLLSSLREALDKGDSEAARRAAHTLKSTSASLGALELSSDSGLVEKLAAESDLAAAAARIPALDAQFNAVAMALRARADGSTAP
jgi:two-component system sensor histidine kinase BarA